MATFELYRRSTIGMCLTDTLDEMVQNGTLTPELAIQVLVQFDKSMTEALETQVKSKVTIKGHLHTYRFCDNVWTFILQDAVFKSDECQETVDRMATSKDKQVPRIHHFELVEGMKLQQGSLQTLFTKTGETYVVIVELRDSKMHAIEFVLKDGSHDRWLKLDRGNFRIEVPETDTNTCHRPIPKDLIDRKAYLIWESKGKPQSSPQQQQQGYNDALRELQSQLSNGISVKELQSSHIPTSTTSVPYNRDKLQYGVPSFHCRRHDVQKWLQKLCKAHSKRTTLPSSTLVDLVENFVGGDNVISQQSYHIGNHEIVVLSKIISSNYHILVAVNMKGATVLHWGVSKLSGE
ncbi:hypothetical protein Ddye_006499 [Dipteronia dyeriana]|uniref:Transcription initiation factor IIA subunit 2 n=1 Tax=Dipteronia dyeriana TaxID=168575 RepID=A0AAE0CQS8_9ROSI|nr:hypothetical protein Ddye_006499 [Dipteronia dyeriana]